VIPTGLTGLIIAGVFAAAISSLDSILAALAQTTMSAFYMPFRERQLSRLRGTPVGLKGDALTAPENAAGAPGETPPTTPVHDPAEDRRTVRVSRVFVIFWGIALCAMAQLAEQASRFYPSILDLALSMAGYAGGALLAGFMLGFLPLRINGIGYLWSAPLSVLTVFGLVWHQWWAPWICWIGAAVLLVTWITYLLRRQPSGGANPVLQTVSLLVGIAIMLLINHYGYFEGPIDPTTGEPSRLSIAWPWQAPIGSLVAFVWGYLLAGPKDDDVRRA
jgi:Na+/proline symporter